MLLCVLDENSEDKVIKRFIKIDKMSTAYGTDDSTPRPYRYGYGVLDENLNGQVDAGEKRLVHQVGLEVFDMRYIDEMGMRHTMELALATLDANTHLHVSFDVDFLDPDIAPGVGTTVPGGPTYREAQLCMEMIADTGRLASLDVMELNPALDVRNKTADLAVDLIESLFGKSTLMRERIV